MYISTTGRTLPDVVMLLLLVVVTFIHDDRYQVVTELEDISVQKPNMITITGIENLAFMRRPRKHSASPLPSTAAASTAKTVNAVSKTGYKMTWKNAVFLVLKIGRQKLVESVANNPEKRKSGKAVAIAVIDDDSSRAVHLSKSSLLNKKKSISKIARQIISSVKSDTEASPNSETNDGDRNDSNIYEIADQNDFAQNSSSSSVSSPIVSQLYLCKKEEQTGTDESVPLVSSSVSPQLCSCKESIYVGTIEPTFFSLSVMQQSSTVIDNSNKRMENVNEERENLLEETEMLECSTTNTNRELSEEEKHMVLADFDAGMLPHEIEEKYGVSKLQIADVLSNRISIFRTSWSDLFTLKRRRTVYVLSGPKIWLNGRQLKEQALKIAHELGLHSFKASEGWLDSFKRRHCIDLKAMTGKPVIYEADPEEANSVNDGLEIKICFSARSATPSPKLIRDTNSLSTVLDANKFLMDATDAAVLASTDRSDSDIAMTNPTQATVAIRTTSPLDIQRLLPGPSVVNEQNLLLPTVNTSEIAASSVQALLETCCYRVNEMEVAQAIDTLRAYIVSNNINLLPVLVELQKSLAAIAAQRKATEKISSRI
ncbi:Major centromere autoantigen B [Dirofilaria immitis]|nr:Major centromere autoantigen B [Dirofilaria immitis]